MKDKLELLDPKLLSTSEFKEFRYWKKVVAAEVGWHYPLDITWILYNLKRHKLPKGSVILDAGGGYGLMQFILAGEGYKIISVDLTSRKKLLPLKMLFKINIFENKMTKYKYMSHINSVFKNRNLLQKALILSKRLKYFSPLLFIHEVINRKQHGEINFYQGDFSNLSLLKNNSVDAIVSCSSIEHCTTYKTIQKSFAEFTRIIKPNSPIIITTSATNKKTWFHKPSQGWCFSKEDLIKLFKLKKPISNYKYYKLIFTRIFHSEQLKNNLPSYYFTTGNSGMPWGKWNPKYLPVGVLTTYRNSHKTS
ncbi:hypothetical protein A3A76_03670 [Candidatus Woesebacteria bacterium RIFCSPLOWO2_01_FULL_39_23]|uniref:Methyltransferase type 11 domain-containing protein n=1 Tax=Candidatus Woesebacteria bacterium RIFCSPHIGHO2_01_FULL_40_22 TaxID=1802499 RepID=A0A1F7YJT2_9BACT|nr:MAG: hypothetical protein A2141_00355 [Candidatus Woesebacteria bacterium RBG_16_40_11]OGM27553.1 MAG: hypothetical protein A2628_02070 [Candidatus Woesebacteria bacterium RIFCSPHIGHO2_01_FULL_40_22]OGM62727.1 MAG: hypothetical protein A3A76_03670 [Candidatus Woesebacteria bacterium RIFCSPLOWO2_01_FULL_39_23]